MNLFEKFNEQKDIKVITYLSKPIAIRWKTEFVYRKVSVALIKEHPYLAMFVRYWK